MRFCNVYDTIFKESEQVISKSLIKKKYKMSNSFWGRVKENGTFPRNSGTSIKKVRLTRIGFGQHNVGWEQIVDDGCDTNLCAQPERETIRRGWDESSYTIERFGIKTDDICLALLPFREMPEQELDHYQEHIGMLARYHWNEYARSRYYNLVENKFVVVVPVSAVDGDCGTCNILSKHCFPDIKTDGWVMWKRLADGTSSPVGAGTVDERYISVNVSPNQLSRISELTLDIVDVAAERLELEDENMAFLSEGIELFDLVLANNKQSTRMAYMEDSQMNNVHSFAGYEAKFLKRRLGTKRVFRDMYSTRIDTSAPRFYPDKAYNATILAAFGAYSPIDPLTWPRLIRVFPYRPALNSNKTVRVDVNNDWINAPFGLSTIFSPLVYNIQAFPATASMGGAKLGNLARTYGGEVHWINRYDAKCNPREEIGHWELDFGAAAEPNKPENGYAFLHRIDHSISLAVPDCELNEATCVSDFTANCYNSLATGEEALGVVIGERGANTVDDLNSNKFLI